MAEESDRSQEDIIRIASNLAFAYLSNGDKTNATRVVDEYVQENGESPAQLELRATRASLMIETYQFKKVIAELEVIIPLMIQKMPNEVERIGKSLGNLSGAHNALQNHYASRMALDEALDVIEVADLTNSEVGFQLRRLELILIANVEQYNVENWELGLQLATDLKQESEKHLGRFHPLTIVFLGEKGKLLSRLGRADEGVVIQEEALKRHKLRFPHSRLETARLTYDLACGYYSAKDIKNSVRVFSEYAKQCKEWKINDKEGLIKAEYLIKHVKKHGKLPE